MVSMVTRWLRMTGHAQLRTCLHFGALISGRRDIDFSKNFLFARKWYFPVFVEFYLFEWKCDENLFQNICWYRFSALKQQINVEMLIFFFFIVLCLKKLYDPPFIFGIWIYQYCKRKHDTYLFFDCVWF